MKRKLGIGVVAAVLALAFANSASAIPAPVLDAHGSMEQVYATGLPPGSQVELLNSSDQVIRTGTANHLGGILFRNVAPGSGYKVRKVGPPTETSAPLTVLTTQSAPPDPSIYTSQSIPTDGYGYMTTRDGTKLAYSVHPPSDVQDALNAGLPVHPPLPSDPSPAVPGPVLVEYSGYGYARPEGPVSGIAALANIMGFTVVDVNMRGTGCSGGAFDFFEPAQSLDGYDVVETVAHQPWVKNNKVGMLGISYGGISQLFTGQTQPPSLAALAPLSVIDQTQTTLYPGGVLNTGFAVAWAAERQFEARPADPAADPNDARFGGQPYARDQITAEGPTGQCAKDQALHPEAADLIGKIRENDHYIPEVADPLSPTTFVDKINVPTFMACQWTDEQTGGHCPTLAAKILNGPHPEQKFFTFTNGVHVDSLSPETYNKMYDFFQIYVNQVAPSSPTQLPLVQASWPVVMQAIYGIDGPGGAPPPAALPPDPIQAQPTLATAKAAFEAQKPIRILFDNGAGSSGNPGWPYPGFERSYDSWPIPGTTARSFYLGPDGVLGDHAATATAADGFTWDSHARPLTNFTGDTGSGDNGLWTATPPYNWSQDPAGKAVAYLSSPLTADASVVGAGAVNLWVRSSTPNVDLQATVSEVRPDGKETFVQGGWLRTKARALDEAKSTPLEPVLSLRQEDFSAMPADHFVPVTIPLYYEGHMYRSGSRIRVRITAPNGDQPIWSFGEADPAGQANVAIGYGPEMPSRLLLPVVPGGAAPTGLPPCPGLRGEPCRAYQSFQNTAAAVGNGPKTARKCAKKKHRHRKHAGKSRAKHKKKRHCHKKKKRKKKA
jgi:predicted acyl esterase